MTNLRRRRHRRRRPIFVGARTTNRVPWVLHCMGMHACMLLIIKYILDMATLACLAVQLIHVPGTWSRIVPWPPLASTSTTWHRRVQLLAVRTIWIPPTWGRPWDQLLEALGNFALQEGREAQPQVWKPEYWTIIPDSCQVGIQVLLHLARSRWRVRVYLRLEIRF